MLYIVDESERLDFLSAADLDFLSLSFKQNFLLRFSGSEPHVAHFMGCWGTCLHSPVSLVWLVWTCDAFADSSSSFHNSTLYG